MSEVLVTGGSGFIGTHVILQLLAAGHRVRATLRTPARQSEVLAMLQRGGATDTGPLSFYAADLTRDDGWAQAATGCDYVLHIASPLPAHVPKDENELIVPAREGTLRVLRAARDAGVKRAVVTSSFAAIGYGHVRRSHPFDETDWSELDGPAVQPYPKSKTLAERAAWHFVAQEGGGLELATVNPVAVLGPVLGPDVSTSIAMVQALLAGRIPAVPRISFGLVDVRDVADLHLRAMTSPAPRCHCVRSPSSCGCGWGRQGDGRRATNCQTGWRARWPWQSRNCAPCCRSWGAIARPAPTRRSVCWGGARGPTRKRSWPPRRA